MERTGVAEATLRMWERRHGFPSPERLPSGHRRYSERDVELVRRVAERRAAGLTLAVAIERAREADAAVEPSLFAALRRSHPELEPRSLARPLMVALSQAIEDEILARAERPLLFGAFQRERFYRRSEHRWRELARQSELAVAFADFAGLRIPAGAPAEIPLERDHPLGREWAVVCDAPGCAVCLAAWEPPGTDPSPARPRAFEAVWSVDDGVVREASRVCSALAAAPAPELIAPVRAQLEAEPGRPAREQLRLATAITNRMLARLSAGAAP